MTAVSSPPGEALTLQITHFLSGDVGVLQVRVVSLTSGATMHDWSATAIVQTTATAAGPPWTYTATRAGLPAGVYQAQWRRSSDVETVWIDDEDVLVAVAGVAVPPWRPSLFEIAQVTPAYTRGGFDDDDEAAGAEHAVFTDSTSPTASHVQGLITTACEEIKGRAGMPIRSEQYGLARATAKWHVAASIAAGKVPAGTEDASGEYRGHVNNFRASLDELVRQARMPFVTRLH